MNRFLLMMVLAAGVALAAPSPAEAVDKVTICHATGSGSYVTLTIPRNAAYGQAGHFNENGTPKAGHEDDYLGPCRPPDTTTTSTTTTTTSTTTTTTQPTTTSSTTSTPDRVTTTSSSTPDRVTTTSSSTPDRVTTTVVVIDTCEDLGTCPEDSTTTTVPGDDSTTTVSSTIAEGGLSAQQAGGITLAGLVLTLLGSGALLIARRP